MYERGFRPFTSIIFTLGIWDDIHEIIANRFDVADIGWAFRKEDRRLRDAVQAIFNKQPRDESSELNRIWKEEFGVKLNQMKALIHATK